MVWSELFYKFSKATTFIWWSWVLNVEWWAGTSYPNIIIWICTIYMFLLRWLLREKCVKLWLILRSVVDCIVLCLIISSWRKCHLKFITISVLWMKLDTVFDKGTITVQNSCSRVKITWTFSNSVDKTTERLFFFFFSIDFQCCAQCPVLRNTFTLLCVMRTGTQRDEKNRMHWLNKYLAPMRKYFLKTSPIFFLLNANIENESFRQHFSFILPT